MIERMIKLPPKKNINFIKNYFKNHNLLKHLKADETSFNPDLFDLFRIHQFITLNKRITALEFGCGWSTVIIKHALDLNKQKYKDKIIKLRKKDTFELFTVDNQKKFLKLTKKKCEKILGKKIKIDFHFSECQMTKFNGRFASEYKKIPVVNPDFIYLDGPDPSSVQSSVNNFNTKHLELMPMSCDILKIEPFLIPGTIILVDGRTANSNFLKNNLQRKWIYKRDAVNDQSIFFLNDESLGKLNTLQLNFFKSKK